MGRKKINIRPIAHPSTRRATFEKRRIGLFKKAMELSILCQSTLSLTIYTSEGEVYVYSSEPYENVIKKFQNYRGPYRLLTNDHLEQMIPGKSASNSIGFEIIKQPANVNPYMNNMNNTAIMMPRIINSDSSLTPNTSSTGSSKDVTPPSISSSSSATTIPRYSSSLSSSQRSSLSSTCHGINQMNVGSAFNKSHNHLHQGYRHSLSAISSQSQSQSQPVPVQMQAPPPQNSDFSPKIELDMNNMNNEQKIDDNPSSTLSTTTPDKESSNSSTNELNKIIGKRRSYQEMIDDDLDTQFIVDGFTKDVITMFDDEIPSLTPPNLSDNVDSAFL